MTSGSRATLGSGDGLCLLGVLAGEGYPELGVGLGAHEHRLGPRRLPVRGKGLEPRREHGPAIVAKQHFHARKFARSAAIAQDRKARP